MPVDRRQGSVEGLPASERPERSEPPLTWTVRPASGSPLRTMLVLPLVAAACWFGLRWFGPPGLTLVLLFSLPQLIPYFALIRYTVTDEGIEIRTFYARAFKPWTLFRGFYAYPDAVQLLHAGRSLRLKLLQGTLVYTEPGSRVDFMRFLHQRFGDPGGKGPAPGPDGGDRGGQVEPSRRDESGPQEPKPRTPEPVLNGRTKEPHGTPRTPLQSAARRLDLEGIRTESRENCWSSEGLAAFRVEPGRRLPVR